MKRIYPAIIIIILICIFCIGYSYILGKYTDKLIGTLDEFDRLVTVEDFEGARKKFTKLNREWENAKRIAGIITGKKVLEEIGFFIRGLEYCVNLEVKRDCQTYYLSARYNLENLSKPSY